MIERKQHTKGNGNRPDQYAYEANFGLLREDGTAKDSWEWYDALPNE